MRPPLPIIFADGVHDDGPGLEALAKGRRVDVRGPMRGEVTIVIASPVHVKSCSLDLSFMHVRIEGEGEIKVSHGGNVSVEGAVLVYDVERQHFGIILGEEPYTVLFRRTQGVTYGSAAKLDAGSYIRDKPGCPMQDSSRQTGAHLDLNLPPMPRVGVGDVFTQRANGVTETLTVLAIHSVPRGQRASPHRGRP